MAVNPDPMARIRRERATESKLRGMDTHDIVALIHELEDRIEDLEAEVESQADALKDCGYISPV